MAECNHIPAIKISTGKYNCVNCGIELNKEQIEEGTKRLKEHIKDMEKAERVREILDKPPHTIKEDMVNHPPHYTSHPSGVECIEITRHMNFNLGNAFKYIWRAGLKKNAVEDLEKAEFYIKDEIKRLKKGK